MSHIATKEQQKAFKALEKAFKKCNQVGLAIYGKQYHLTAYTKEAEAYIEQFNFESIMGGAGDVVPHLHIKVLADSGADDYARYRNKADEEKHNPS